MSGGCSLFKIDIRLKASILSFACAHVREAALQIIGVHLGVHIGVYQPCPELKRTLVAMSERTGLSVSQVTDEVLYTGSVEMQEMPEL
jgi:hypothetical protein